MNTTPASLTRRRLVGLAGALALHGTAIVLATPQAASDAVAERQAAFDQAARAFRERRYASAYGQFARLADAGHPAAASAALLMQREARDLFGNAWYATPDQRRRWAALAAAHLSQGTPPAPGGHDEP